jgi:hypothetical protein
MVDVSRQRRGIAVGRQVLGRWLPPEGLHWRRRGQWPPRGRLRLRAGRLLPAEQTATAVDVLTDLLAIELRIAHVVVATTGQGARFGAGTRTTVELLAP